MLMTNTLVQQPSRPWSHAILPVKAEQKPLYRSFIMGMAVFSPTVSRSPVLALLLAPLQDLVALFSPIRHASASAPSCSGTNSKAIRPISSGATRAMDKASWRATASVVAAQTGHDAEKSALRPAAPNRLRVLRAFDPGIAPSCAGRMVISGRMADVCAELDRMTKKEASACR
ncbi:MAG: hypothetical protein HYX42_03580 [Polaromonas sp.]|nr:hypothetical protein [Polaromonas sp.]